MRTLALLIAALGSLPLSAHPEEDQAPVERQVPYFEISLGDSTLFSPKVAFDDPGEIIPTSSFLFMGEYFINYAWRVIAVFNLPITTEQLVVNGTTEQRKAAPTVAVGVNFSPWGVEFGEERRFELQFGALGGMQIKAQPEFFPVLAARAYLLHGKDIGIYLGSAFAIRIDTAALIWGLGYRF